MRLLSRDAGVLHISADLDTKSAGFPFKYAILSHRWRDDTPEVTFQDVADGIVNTSGFPKQRLTKIDFCLSEAAKMGIAHVWIDSCCINRQDKYELSKSINKMFAYYAEATVCFVYLADVKTGRASMHELHASQWFRRGWTLQELIAPRDVRFFTQEGDLIGDKQKLWSPLMSITNIDVRRPWSDIPIPRRFAWSMARETKEEEDMSYCLLGILEVSIIPNYGEGAMKAQERLLEAVEKEHGMKVIREIRKMNGATGWPQYQNMLFYENMNARRDTIVEPFPDTCEWLHKHTTFHAWASMELRFVWLKGKPGSGKSTLMKHADLTSSWQYLKISFYFNARGTHLEKCIEGMYRSLLFQILSNQRENARDAIDDFLHEQGKYHGLIRLTLSSLQNAFELAVKSIKEPIQCFIDALDECNDAEIQRMIHHLEDLSQKSSLFVCFASRYYPTITVRSPEIRLEQQSEQGLDLENYVNGRLQRDANLHQEVIKKANGVFLWAVLVVRMLNDDYSAGRQYNLRARLDELPSELDELLNSIASRRENRVEFKLAMQWIMFARRPLSSLEYYFAMLAGLNKAGQVNESSYCLAAELIPLDQRQITKFVDSTSRGLAELTKSAVPRVQFIHESVRDFWLSHGRLFKTISQHKLKLTHCVHDELKTICYHYIMTRSIYHQLERAFDGIDAVDEDINIMLGLNSRHPFLAYAIVYMFHHSDSASSQIPQHSFLDDFTTRSAYLLGRCQRALYDQEGTKQQGGLDKRYGSLSYQVRDVSIILMLVVGAHERLLEVAANRGYLGGGFPGEVIDIILKHAEISCFRVLLGRGLQPPQGITWQAYLRAQTWLEEPRRAMLSTLIGPDEVPIAGTSSPFEDSAILAHRIARGRPFSRLRTSVAKSPLPSEQSASHVQEHNPPATTSLSSPYVRLVADRRPI